MEDRNADPGHARGRGGWIVVAVACLVFVLGAVSPPRLMDDVDAVQATIARNMLHSGDWVTARLNGVAYLEKSPLSYWIMATSFRVFGAHDWAARLPLALGVVLLCWLTYRIGRWGFGEDAGTFAGVGLATSAGLFLFTRILIPDALLTLAVAGAIWACLRLLEPDESHPIRWSLLLGFCLGCGLLLKGLIALVFPVITVLAYMAVTRQLFSADTWRRLHLGWAILVALVVSVPWHVLATLANPPYFSFSMHSGPGEYRGFFWFHFINEHLLRFLNKRYPRDYNTVPRLWFWLLNLVWLFPWSAYVMGVPGLAYRPASRAGRLRLLALCWIGTVMLFFSFSTTQEYYSMPIYPALALLLAGSLAAGSRWVRRGTNLLIAVFSVLFVALAVVLGLASRMPADGTIAQALTQHPELYTLSMGHMADLTLNAFAYLKLPLALAAVAFGGAACGLALVRKDTRRTVLVLAVSMIVFLQAVRVALVRFQDYLGSYPLARSLEQSPRGQLIEADAYYAFSSVFFYTGRTALLWNGRSANLEYGSYAPGAPKVFIGDTELTAQWQQPGRSYLLAYGAELPRVKQLVGEQNVYVVAENAGNFLLTNRPLPSGR